MLTENIVILRLILSIILGGVIGVERGVRGRAAGLRTHILVCAGSCLIMMTSIYLLGLFKTTGIDPSKMAAGVITGIGFLGAGTIIRAGGAVQGLTTAASIWVVAAVGLAIGCGFYLGAAATAVLMLGCLMFFRRIESKLGVK